MLVFKFAPVLLLAFVVRAEKKIELQDIEEDNLKSEIEKDKQHEPITHTSPQNTLPLEFLENTGHLRYFENPEVSQSTRYIQQYDVTEAPVEKPTDSPKLNQYLAPTTQQAMVSYVSNIPMAFFLLPQYQTDPESNSHSGYQYVVPSMNTITYAPETVQQQIKYVEVPAYITSSGKIYFQPYSSPISNVQFSQPTMTPVPVYQMPVPQYPTTLSSPPILPKEYQPQHYTETNTIEEPILNELEKAKEYPTQAEGSNSKPISEYLRYYTSKTPIRENQRHNIVSELPPPNPLLLKSSPPHLSHIPKVLPRYRPLNKPVYASNSFPHPYPQKPSEAYGVPFKRRPTSLLDSYIPSHIQLEYLKRGYVKDPAAVYEALLNARQHSKPATRQYERGFLPNQIYHTAAGGITYGHYKRAARGGFSPQK